MKKDVDYVLHALKHDEIILIITKENNFSRIQQPFSYTNPLWTSLQKP